MLSDNYQYENFPYYLGNLIITIIPHFFKSIKPEFMAVLLNTIQNFISQKFWSCECLLIRMADLLNEITKINGQECGCMFADNFCLEILEFYFRLSFDVTYKSYIFSLAMSLQTLMSNYLIKNKWNDIINIIYKLIPNCPPTQVQKILESTMKKEFFTMTLRDFLINARFLAKNDPDLQFNKEKLKQKIKMLADKDDELKDLNSQSYCNQKLVNIINNFSIH